MSIIKELIHGNHYDLAKGLDALQDRADDLCHEQAERMNIDISAAISNLDEYAAHLPDSVEVAARLTKDQRGDWQEVLRTTAILATRAHLEAEVEADIAKIKAALHEAELTGYQALKLYSTNAHGWVPHTSEIDWTTGTLHLWRFSDGTIDAGMLEVELADVAEIWIDLAPVD